MIKGKHIKYTFFSLLAASLLISATIVIYSKEGLKKIEIKLEDRETVNLASIIDPVKKDDLFNRKPFPNITAAVVRSFDNDTNNVIDLVNYANFVSESRNLGYWSVIPFTYYGETFSNTRIADPTYTFRDQSSYDWKKISGFRNYYHLVFRNKGARTILADHTIDFLCTLCKAYPSDFKTKLNKELSILLAYTNTLKPTSPYTNTDRLNDYWKGFILRRVKSDNIPITEIQSTIIKAQARIDSLDVKNQPEAMYEIVINNQISLLYAIDNFKLISKSSAIELKFGYEVSLQSIFFNKDSTGDYYMMSGSQNGKPFKWLYNKNLERVN